ncbi:unnamed protein product, partial [Linum tenue]
QLRRQSSHRKPALLLHKTLELVATGFLHVYALPAQIMSSNLFRSGRCQNPQHLLHTLLQIPLVGIFHPVADSAVRIADETHGIKPENIPGCREG